VHCRSLVQKVLCHHHHHIFISDTWSIVRERKRKKIHKHIKHTRHTRENDKRERESNRIEYNNKKHAYQITIQTVSFSSGFFDFNWLPWQRPLRYQKRGPDWSHSNKYLSFGAKIAIIGLVDPEIISPFKKEAINASKIYSPVGKLVTNEI